MQVEGHFTLAFDHFGMMRLSGHGSLRPILESCCIEEVVWVGGFSDPVESGRRRGFPRQDLHCHHCMFFLGFWWITKWVAVAVQSGVQEAHVLEHKPIRPRVKGFVFCMLSKDMLSSPKSTCFAVLTTKPFKTNWNTQLWDRSLVFWRDFFWISVEGKSPTICWKTARCAIWPTVGTWTTPWELLSYAYGRLHQARETCDTSTALSW